MAAAAYARVGAPQPLASLALRVQRVGERGDLRLEARQLLLIGDALDDLAVAVAEVVEDARARGAVLEDGRRE